MNNKTMAYRHTMPLVSLALAVVAATNTGAKAGTISYSDIVTPSFKITNITESNDLAGNVALYGAPALAANGHSITFDPSSNPFSASAADGGSAFLRGVLNFDVEYIDPPAVAPNVALSESGVFSGTGDAYATVTPFLFLLDHDRNLISSTTGTITPPDPFLGGAGNTLQSVDWSGSAQGSSATELTSVHVLIDNDLSAVAQTGASATVAKQLISIDFCPDCVGAVPVGTPEPASLGLLSLGGLALLVRRGR